MVSYSLILVILAFPKYLSSYSSMYVLATCLEVSNGFINVCTFNLQSVVARRMLASKGFALGISCWDSDFEAPAATAGTMDAASVHNEGLPDESLGRADESPRGLSSAGSRSHSSPSPIAERATNGFLSPANGFLTWCANAATAAPRHARVEDDHPLNGSENRVLSILSYLEGADMLRALSRPAGRTSSFTFIPSSIVSSANGDSHRAQELPRSIDNLPRAPPTSQQQQPHSQWLSQQLWQAEDDGTWRCSTQAPLLLEQLFDVGRKLGSGAFGEVHRAKARLSHGPFQDGQQYALKILNKDVFRRDHISKYAYQERDVMKITKHPCLVRLVSALQIYQPIAKWILVMEYCHGGSLRQKLLDLYGTSIDPSWQLTARRYGSEVLLGMEYLHSKQIVHRDIKPDNIVLSGRDHCKVADFGFARLLHVGETSIHEESQPNLASQASHTGNGSSSTFAPNLDVLRHPSLDSRRPSMATNWVGTWIYTAPEVADGHYDSSVDIYSWGVMLFELLTVIDPEPPTEPGYAMDFRDHFRRQLTYAGAADSALELCVRATSTVPASRGNVLYQKEDPFFEGVDWELLLLDCSELEVEVDGDALLPLSYTAE